jgi:hypothetical protein
MLLRGMDPTPSEKEAKKGNNESSRIITVSPANANEIYLFFQLFRLSPGSARRRRFAGKNRHF